MSATLSLRILFVDDEEIIVKLAQHVLKDAALEFVAYTDPREAAKEDFGRFDVVISDFHMPHMRGDEFLAQVRLSNSDVPFIFLTNTSDIATAVELLRRGADDFIQKPIDPNSLLFRVERNVKAKQRERQIAMIQREHELLDLENRKLANWRLLYASKEARQTEQLITNLARNVNQAGGFLWLDMLSDSHEELDENHYRIPKAVLEMALAAAKNQKKLLDQIGFIGSIDSMELEVTPLTTAEAAAELHRVVAEELNPLAVKHGRTIALGKSFTEAGTVRINVEWIRRILHELCVNAIKYSPAETPIMIDLGQEREQSTSVFVVNITNYARQMQAKGDAEAKIIGIPYDYLELVFDLFFTIEAFPEYMEDEVWPDGTGLYLARRIIKRMNGWISAHSGLDYTHGDPRPVVRMDIRLPVEAAGRR